MNRDELLDLLRTHKAILARRFGVTELAIFGSFARDQGSNTSDIDILVGFDAPPFLIDPWAATPDSGHRLSF